MFGHFADRVLDQGHFRRVSKLFARRKAGLPDEVAAAIEAAEVFPRPGSDDAPRVFVALNGGLMRGSFEFSTDEARQRIARRWPELTSDQLDRAVAFLGARVRLAAAPIRNTRRKSWVFDY